MVTLLWTKVIVLPAADGLSPNLIGQDVDEFDVVLKYVSDYDLVSYGATKEIVDDESVFSWDSNLDNILDKYGQAKRSRRP